MNTQTTSIHRKYSQNRYKAAAALLASFAAVGLASSASAQILTKAANNTALNVDTSWTEVSVPSSANTLSFTSAWTGAQVQMGTSLTVAGISYGNVANNSGRISGTGGQTLSLGSVGVDLTGTGGNLRIDPAVILTADQEWSIASGRLLNLVASGMTGSFTAQATGAGTLAFDASGTATYGSQLEVDVATLRINFGATNVTFTNPNNSFTNLTLFNGTGQFSSIANAGADSAAGAFTTASMGGNATNGVFIYTGNTAETNRSFSVDRRSTASAILVSTAGQTLTIGGTISHVGSNAAIAHNNFRVGGDGNLILNGVVSNNTTPGFNTTLAKEGAGTLTLGAANTFAGGVSVSAGTLLVSNTTGSGTGSGNVSVSSGAALGGDGTISGNVTFDPGAKFVFSISSTLDVSGTTTLPTSFGIDDLVGLSNSVASTTYTLIAGSGSISYTTLENLGSSNALDIGLGKSAYFDLTGDNLSVTVTSAVPEPSAFAAFAGLGAVAFAGLRRRRCV